MDFQEMLFFLQKMPTDEWQPGQMEVRGVEREGGV